MKYKKATCRGFYLFDTACGNCERCAEEKAKMGNFTVEEWKALYNNGKSLTPNNSTDSIEYLLDNYAGMHREMERCKKYLKDEPCEICEADKKNMKEIIKNLQERESLARQEERERTLQEVKQRVIKIIEEHKEKGFDQQTTIESIKAEVIVGHLLTSPENK